MSWRSTVLALAASLALVGGNLAATPGAAHPAPRLSRGPLGTELVRPGYLTIGTDATYPPMEYTQPRTQRIVGADIDLGRALARAMGLKGAIIKNNAFDTIIPALFRRNYDVIMSSMSDTSKRRKQIGFVDYMRAGQAILVRANSSIRVRNFTGLCGRSIAVQSGTTQLDELRRVSSRCRAGITIKSDRQ